MKWYEKFKVGQEVKVTRKTGNWNYGESASWVYQMDTTVGKVYKIERIDKYFGCRLASTDGPFSGYWYPIEALQIITGQQLLFEFYK